MARVGLGAVADPRGEGVMMGDDGWKRTAGYIHDVETLAGREDRGLGCLENLDRGVARATGHG